MNQCQFECLNEHPPICFIRTIKQSLTQDDIIYRKTQNVIFRNVGYSRHFADRDITVHYPPFNSENIGKKILPNYMEKTIGKIRYRIRSEFAEKGDFQTLSEKLLESRVWKHYGEGC